MSDLYSVDHIYRNEFGEVQSKDVGVFSSKEQADAAVASVMDMPGFCDHTSGFIVEKVIIDKVFWEEGFDPGADDGRLLPHHEKP
ncbi:MULTISPECIES: hypothetical protein [unclassified Rhizobium]|uniref:hypothetical protein n=1 Tax=unclassified Rhizobium TaxID=2613769 RepID=UPI00071392E0|nr:MULTISPECIES: hypothetical protein [unclassified Rhizobium]KQT01806.1 hypothetical protein ASG50_19145 [Rhizobium sp. Leaf386]KQT03236.1 hypothetical protein ASG42_24835 [Rhizobium sp. Leaf391]KQU08355.1 hypothetical protein ASG68_22450 [Rhizobium sp. Leaf453]